MVLFENFLNLFFDMYTPLYLYIYFWLHWFFIAACGLFLVLVSGGYSLVAACGLTAVASLVAEHRLYGAWASVVVTRGLYSTGSIVMVHGFSCLVTCGIFSDQGSNPCPLHWQADS